jgi:hypothetical protein
LPGAVSSSHAQGEHEFCVFHAPPGASRIQTLLRDIAMRTFDVSGTDRQVVGQGLAMLS